MLSWRDHVRICRPKRRTNFHEKKRFFSDLEYDQTTANNLTLIISLYRHRTTISSMSGNCLRETTSFGRTIVRLRHRTLVNTPSVNTRLFTFNMSERFGTAFHLTPLLYLVNSDISIPLHHVLLIWFGVLGRFGPDTYRSNADEGFSFRIVVVYNLDASAPFYFVLMIYGYRFQLAWRTFTVLRSNTEEFYREDVKIITSSTYNNERMTIVCKCSLIRRSKHRVYNTGRPSNTCCLVETIFVVEN